MSTSLSRPVPYSPDDPLHPQSLSPAYASTVPRSPRRPLVRLPQTLTETTGPTDIWGRLMLPPVSDLTRVGKGEPIGERIIVSGRVLDDRARPVANTVVEVWQCNAAGRYIHERDQHDAPLDPNFVGEGRVITDEAGRYSFVTIKPAPYPWRNHPNAWRPAHIHFSLFGPAFATRLVTQMYFPGDPLIPIDPIAGSVPEEARARMVSRFDIETSKPEWALGYVFDIVLRGRDATPMEP
jgi:protocatechuate 3,4-dioxygenase, beta subunit